MIEKNIIGKLTVGVFHENMINDTKMNVNISNKFTDIPDEIDYNGCGCEGEKIFCVTTAVCKFTLNRNAHKVSRAFRSKQYLDNWKG